MAGMVGYSPAEKKSSREILRHKDGFVQKRKKDPLFHLKRSLNFFQREEGRKGGSSRGVGKRLTGSEKWIITRVKAKGRGQMLTLTIGESSWESLSWEKTNALKPREKLIRRKIVSGGKDEQAKKKAQPRGSKTAKKKKKRAKNKTGSSRGLCVHNEGESRSDCYKLQRNNGALSCT